MAMAAILEVDVVDADVVDVSLAVVVVLDELVLPVVTGL